MVKPKPGRKRNCLPLLPNGLLDVKPRRRSPRNLPTNPYASKHGPVSPLLSLPGEIRNMIYQYTLRGCHIRESADDTMYVTGEKNGLALLRTCRQIYAEAVLMPYQESQIVIRTNSCLEKLFGSSSAKRESLVSLALVGVIDGRDMWSSSFPEMLSLTPESFPNLRLVRLGIELEFAESHENLRQWAKMEVSRIYRWRSEKGTLQEEMLRINKNVEVTLTMYVWYTECMRGKWVREMAAYAHFARMAEEMYGLTVSPEEMMESF